MSIPPTRQDSLGPTFGPDVGRAKPDDSEWAALEGMAAALAASGRYRVLGRFERRHSYSPDPTPEGVKCGVIVDVETTGTDVSHDAIIELAVLRFEFDATGRVYRADNAVSWLEDPGRAIPEDIVSLTGITDAMVAGRRIDDAAVAAAVNGAVLVIAHNAEFDRRMIERRFSMFDDLHWACSQRDVDWRRRGCRTARLDGLLVDRCAEFHDAHRAADDCHATLHVLAHPAEGGTPPMAELLERARAVTARLWAIRAPFAASQQLKARGYSWNPGTDQRPKAWYIDVPVSRLEAEQEWLRAAAYPNVDDPPWKVQRFGGKARYSLRAGRAEML